MLPLFIDCRISPVTDDRIVGIDVHGEHAGLVVVPTDADAVVEDREPDERSAFNQRVK